MSPSKRDVPSGPIEKRWAQGASQYQSFCLYCQREYGTLAKLKRHLLAEHPGSYAARSIAEERD